MGLRIVKCDATPSSITVFFSDAVQGGDNLSNYKVQSPIGTPLALGGPKPNYVDAQQKAVVILLSAPLVKGNWLTLEASGFTSASGASFDPGGDAIATLVNGDGGVATVVTSVEDAVSYPVWTEDVGFTSPSGGNTSGGGLRSASTGAPLGQLATKAVSDVLGWKIKAGDAKGFVGALSASFTCTEIEGHSECVWKPRTYAVQTDLSGGITGAQASIYTRAKEALDQSLPLLDGAYALDPEADPEDTAALKAVVRNQLNELVGELGILGGPRVSRVNQYFGLLLLDSGTFPPAGGLVSDPDQVGGSLGTLRDQLGLNFTTQDFVNTVEREQNLSNFRILIDYVTSLALSWINNLTFFGLDVSKPFYGTQLVLISRQLSVVAESVDEVRFALDSVFIGPSERQTMELNFNGEPPMFVEDLFSWIYSFATEEGPRLAQDGGKFAVQNTFYPVAQQLQQLVNEAQDPNPANAGLPRGFHTARVQRALAELGDQLQELVDLAKPIVHEIIDEPPAKALKNVVNQVNILTAAVNSLRTAVPKTTKPNLVLFPDKLTFGAQPVGTTSPPQTVTIVNFSAKAFTGPVNISVTGDFTKTDTCSSPLGPSDSCSILVTFAPAAKGMRSGKLTVTAVGQTKTVDLEGLGTKN